MASLSLTLPLPGSAVFSCCFLDNRYGWGPNQAAMVFVFIGVVSTIVQGGLIRQLLPRFGEAKLSVAGLVLIALAFGGLVLIPPEGPIFAARVIHYPGILSSWCGPDYPIHAGADF